ncbi:MAG: sigma-70 family RNA polymerase sigma factor [Elusimicrobia bacterium]|nr:sigma-70 family RNA polymerase sigma factor [Elusimicrobiota bacterium]MBD3411609.1 sigma-70 family RNA polymerase sigma factor [Elusimicrobiota bacterium]
MMDYQEENTASFSHLLEQYKNPVFHYALRMLHNVPEAEDATQDIFVKIFHALPRYKHMGKISTWIFSIAANHIKNILRWKKIRFWVPLGEEKFSTVAHALAFREIGPEQVHYNRQLQADLNKALESLPYAQKTALLLAKYENMSIDDIAEVLKTTPGGVKQLIFRAKISLRKRLAVYH